MADQVDLTGDVGASRDEDEEANLQLLLKRRAQDKRRQVKSYWFEQFPWLELDHKRGLFFCRWCIAGNRVNTMTRGKSSQMPKKHYFQQHELHGEHQSAALQFWRSVAVNSSKMSDTELHTNGRECATSPSPNSSLRLNVILPETPTSFPDSAMVRPSDFVPSYNHIQSAQTINESYHIPQTPTSFPGSALGHPYDFVSSYNHIQSAQTNSKSYHTPTTASPSENCTATTLNDDAVTSDNVVTMPSVSPATSWNQGFDVSARTPSLPVDQPPMITSELIAGLLESNMTPKGTRKIKPVWFTVFPWLLLDSGRQLFFCQYCCAAGRRNIFTDGRSTVNPKKDHFYKHAQTADHASAAIWYEENIQASVNPENSSKHSECGTASAMHDDGGTLSVKVKEEGVSSDEVGEAMMEGVVSQPPKRTDAEYVTLILKLMDGNRTGIMMHKQFLHEFVWLEYSVQGLLKCTACENTGKQNSFSYGQHPGSVTHKRLVMHERLTGHADAVRALRHTQEKQSTVEGESVPEVVVKREIMQEDIHVQPREMSTSSGGGDVAMATESRSEVKPHYDDERRDTLSVFSGHASVNRYPGTHKAHNLRDWAKMISADEHGREQISELTNQDILDIVKAFYADGGTYRAALAYIRQLRPRHASEIQLTTFIESVKALDAKRTTLVTRETDARKLKSFLSRLYKYPKRRKTRMPSESYRTRRVSTFGVGLRVVGHRARHLKCQQHRGANVNTARQSVSGETSMKPAGRDGGHFERLGNVTVAPPADEETVNIVVDSNEWVDFFGDVDSGDLSNECGPTSSADSGERRPLRDLPGIIDMSVLQARPDAVTWMLGAGWGHQEGCRSVQPAWFFQFPWLQYDVSRNRFRCKCCAAHSTVSYFAIGKSANMPKQHTFDSHEASERHKVALQAYNADLKNKPLNASVDATNGATGLLGELHKSPLAANDPLSLVSSEDVNIHTGPPRKLEPLAQEGVQPPPLSTPTMPVVMETQKESYHVDQPHIETTESSWTTNFWQLANQLRHLDIICDVTLTVAPHGVEHEFRAHRLMLVCASDLFKKTLSSGKDRFHFEGVSPKGMKAVLDFIYGQPVHGTRLEYVEYYTAATELCVLAARTAFSKVIQDIDNNTRSTDERQVGAAVVKGSDLNHISHAESLKTKAVIHMTEGETRIQSVVGASDQNEPLLPSSDQTSELTMHSVLPSTSARELTKPNISPSSGLHIMKPATIPSVGRHSQNPRTLHGASMQNNRGSPRQYNYKCVKLKCGRIYARRTNLVHRLTSTHAIERRHRCNWCHKEFVWRTSLLTHEASHVTNVVSVAT